jgi:hypothetical protein
MLITGSTKVKPIDLTEALKDAPAGEWIALSKGDNRIVGTGKTIEEALQKARQSGNDDPVVMKVPPVGALIL